MNLVVTAIGLCLASGGYYLIAQVGRWRDWWADKYTQTWLLQICGILWVATGLQLVFVRFIENRPLRSIGIQPVAPLEFVAGVVVCCFVLMVLAALPEALLQQFGRALPDEKGLYMLAQPVYWKVAFALTAGVTSVILLNGYVIERVLELTGNPLLAVALSTVVAARSNLPVRSEIRVEQIPTALATGFALALLYLLVRNALVVAGGQTLLSLLVFLSNSPEDALFGRDVSDLDDRVAQTIQNAE